MNTCERHGRIRCGECAYIEQLEEEREKLIEVLRWYAATENWRLSLTHMLNDRGKRARDILKEIGVTVDVYD